MPYIPDGAYELQQWLLIEGINCATIDDLLRQLVPRLHAQGIPIDRLVFTIYLTHAQLGAVHHKFESGPDRYSEYPIDKAVFKRMVHLYPKDSPFYKLQSQLSERCRIKKSDTKIADDLKVMFHEEGYTDMYCMGVYNRDDIVVCISYGTKHAEGLQDDHIIALDAILAPLGSVLQLLVQRLVSYSLLCTYLGHDPGRKVFTGSVDRGDSVTVRSVIWFSDVRGFTALSQKYERDEIIGLINDVFEVTEQAVRRHGGEVLKFIGDGCLAIFSKEGVDKLTNAPPPPPDEPVLDDALLDELLEPEDSDCGASQSMAGLEGSMICQMARMAAYECQENLKALRKVRRARGAHQPFVGIGLHYGDCSYGNVGAPSRLDFTVIGPAVNLASRVEGLCKELRSNVLATYDFVQRDTDNAWSYRGSHSLKGVEELVSLFELRAVSDQKSQALFNNLESFSNSARFGPVPSPQPSPMHLSKKHLVLTEGDEDEEEEDDESVATFGNSNLGSSTFDNSFDPFVDF